MIYNRVLVGTLLALQITFHNCVAMQEFRLDMHDVAGTDSADPRMIIPVTVTAAELVVALRWWRIIAQCSFAAATTLAAVLFLTVYSGEKECPYAQEPSL